MTGVRSPGTSLLPIQTPGQCGVLCCGVVVILWCGVVVHGVVLDGVWCNVVLGCGVVWCSVWVVCGAVWCNVVVGVV